MSSTPATAPPGTTQTTTSVGTPLGTAAATANLPSWLSGTWMAFYVLLLILYVFAYWFGAAKIAYDQTGSGLWAFLAFLFAPLYYPYFAFVVSKPAPAPVGAMMGGGIGSTLKKAVKVARDAASAVLKVTK